MSLSKAYEIGRMVFRKERKPVPAAVSIEMENLIRDSDVPILELLDAYNAGVRDESLVAADVELLEAGTFTAQECPDARGE
jgi:hypothetical protein